jgi:biotin transporter BioY
MLSPVAEATEDQVRIIGWAVLGLLAGVAVAFGLGLLWLNLVVVNDFEGAGAMGVAFFFAPLGGLVGLVAGAVYGVAR